MTQMTPAHLTIPKKELKQNGSVNETKKQHGLLLGKRFLILDFSSSAAALTGCTDTIAAIG